MLIIDKEGVRLEAVKGGTATLVEKVADLVTTGMQRGKEKQ